MKKTIQIYLYATLYIYIFDVGGREAIHSGYLINEIFKMFKNS